MVTKKLQRKTNFIYKILINFYYMSHAIVIPTKDRPQLLDRLLEELTAQMQMFGHSFPIYIIDDSKNSTSFDIAQKYSTLADVRYVGEQLRL